MYKEPEKKTERQVLFLILISLTKADGRNVRIKSLVVSALATIHMNIYIYIYYMYLGRWGAA